MKIAYFVIKTNETKTAAWRINNFAFKRLLHIYHLNKTETAVQSQDDEKNLYGRQNLNLIKD